MTQHSTPENLRDPGTCLVTGATGFVGTTLAAMLVKQGLSVRGLVRDDTSAIARSLQAAGVVLVRGDMTQPDTLIEAVKGINTVFHAAAVLGPANLDHSVYRRINSEGVSAMIDACNRTDSMTRFVHLSTVGVLGPLPPKTKADEGTPPHPDDIYEVTKLDGEERVLDAFKRNRFPAVIVRPGWVYGPGDTRTLRLFRMIARRRFMMIGKALNRQHPIFIEDLISGIIRAATVPGIEGRVYHLCGPDILTVNDLCSLVAEAAGVRLFPFRPPVRAMRIPAHLIGRIWHFFGADPPVDHRKVDFFTINRAYSIQRAKEELDWTPAVSFKDGIRRTIDWYREHGRL